ncbi:alpha/beta fold hydrolase [Roseobacter sp. EG26]|uniref:alpha/beta fold hydrolase n=1 Tax=Roseobacter sp. EG26 TaxID=3412477 RepID=UPI003CE52533
MTPLVFVHGFMGGSAQWALQQDTLAASRELIAVDLPGFGENRDLPVINTIKGFADWVIAKLDAKGIGTFNLMGHSMGGMIAQQIAHQVPDRIEKLVLYGTGPNGLLPGRFETIEQSKIRAQQDGVRKTARRISATWFVDSTIAPEYPACAAIAEQSAAKALAAGLDAMRDWSGMEFLKTVASETLVIWGDSDRTYQWSQPELLWRHIPNAHLAVVPGCAHAVHLEKPQIFNMLVEDFLRT